MRDRALLMLALSVGAALTSAPSSAQTWTDFEVGGVTRKALVYVPSGTENPPLLLSLHGMGIGAGWHQGGMMKLEPIADREKFIVVYPEADQELRWDLGGTHDIDFMLAIIDEMAARHGIDRNRVYASGFSMGGMFSYTLACKLPDKIAAIAPGNGYPLRGESGCATTRSVPIFHMHGTADDFVKYSGIHDFLSSKVAAYGCPTTAARTEPYPPDNPASQSFKELWGPCTNSAGQTSEIVLISVTGMIHDWATAGKPNANEDPAFTGKPFDIDGSEEAWAFLKRHSLIDSDPGSGGSPATGGMGGMSGTGGAGSSSSGGSAAGAGGSGGTVAGANGGGAAGASAQQGGMGGPALPAGGGGMMQQGGNGAFAPSGGAPAIATESPASEPLGCSARVGSRDPQAWMALTLFGVALLLQRRRMPITSRWSRTWRERP
jgi:MYXO-CTERM domain-containing protein